MNSSALYSLDAIATFFGLVCSRVQMGGTICVHSEVGQGSEFVFNIVCSAALPAFAAPSLYKLSLSDLAELASIRLLWVSGREARSWARTRLLRCFGVHVERVTTIDDALVALQSSVPHCIVLDADTDSESLCFQHQSILKKLLAFPRVQLLALTVARGSVAAAAAARSLAGSQELAFVSSDSCTRRASSAELVTHSIQTAGSGSTNLAAIAYSIPMHERPMMRLAAAAGETAGDKEQLNAAQPEQLAPSSQHTTLAEHRADIDRKAQELKDARDARRFSSGSLLTQSELERVTHLTKPFASRDLIRHVTLASRQCKDRELDPLETPRMRRDSTQSSIGSAQNSPCMAASSPSRSGFNLPSPMTLSRSSSTSSASSSRIVSIAEQFPLRILLGQSSAVRVLRHSRGVSG